MDNTPYEIFVFKNPGIEIENQSGFIKKIKSGHYQLLSIDNSVIIDNMECVEKSYPSFWEDYKSLGGIIDVIDMEK